MDNLIDRLARQRGIGDAYHDYRGELRHFGAATKTAILRAMGCAVDDPAALEASVQALEIARWGRLLPQIAAARGARIGVDLNVPAHESASSFSWTVDLEDGTRREGVQSMADCPETWRGEVHGSWITRRRFELPVELAPGYHELRLQIAGGGAERCALVMSPPLCFEPPAVREGRRPWGLAVQLYTVRSRRNWGIGDFGDLGELMRWMAPQGAGFIGLNPMHALSSAEPERSSPYSASNRHFLNVLYICVPAVAELDACAAARARVQEPGFARALEDCRASRLVDYRAVAALKFEILGLLFEEFRARQLAGDSERARRFHAFVADGGEGLQLHACFEALDAHLVAAPGGRAGWVNWPPEYHDPRGAAARSFREEHSREVQFHLYLQWLAHEQLVEAQTTARALGMPIGLYGDYAVGANASGSEAWIDQAGFRRGAEIGAPPDPLALKGQGWGIPPPDPVLMESQRVQGFVRLIRHNMRYYGALRLDHVMSLFRLWWVPAGASPAEGAYVHYPLYPLLTVLALESWRRECLVVGEDLGVVPDEMRRAMHEFGVYHYKVMLFEKQDGRFRSPDEYTRRALATATTHDMPTLRSFWEGRDIELRRSLDLYPSAEIALEVERERRHDRQALLDALRAQGLAPANPATPDEPFTPQLAQALHAYLARSKSVLAAVQIEDLLGMVDPVNVPGTDLEYPNWRRKLDADLEDLRERPDLAPSFATLNRERG